jgi:hypothetical protein
LSTTSVPTTIATTTTSTTSTSVPTTTSSVGSTTAGAGSDVSLQATWIGGSQSANDAGSYSAIGVVSSSNMPRARKNSIMLSYNDKIYMLTGDSSVGKLCDVFEYNPSTYGYKLLAGSNTSDVATFFGTQGTTNSSITPGGIAYSSAQIDPNTGLIYLFGGLIYIYIR